MKDWICDFFRLFDTKMDCTWKNIIRLTVKRIINEPIGAVVLTILIIVAYYAANAQKKDYNEKTISSYFRLMFLDYLHIFGRNKIITILIISIVSISNVYSLDVKGQYIKNIFCIANLF